MFTSCGSLKVVPRLNTSRGTTFKSMFSSANTLYNVAQIDTSRGTTFTGMFSQTSLLELPALNFSSGSVFTNIFANIQGVGGLRRLQVTGIAQNIDLTNQQLSSIELNEIYTNLATVGAAGSNTRTITVTGNWGTPNDTPSIAQNKGWQVTG